jgi:hypothetical protein
MTGMLDQDPVETRLDREASGVARDARGNPDGEALAYGKLLASVDE